jgi:hypothetical protein
LGKFHGKTPGQKKSHRVRLWLADQETITCTAKVAGGRRRGVGSYAG